MNRMIRIPQVRVIADDGEQLGVMQTRDALARAEADGLDLVEVAPTASPPVCRLMDYGRFRYEQQKKNRQRAKSQSAEQKEIRLRPSTEQHDYDTKLRHAREFLGAGNRVKLTVRFRGRELAHRELGRDVLQRFANDLTDMARTEGRMMDEGRNVSLNLIPAKAGTQSE